MDETEDGPEVGKMLSAIQSIWVCSILY